MRLHRPIAIAAAALIAAGGTAGHPKPSSVPVRWELQFDAGALRLYVDRAGESAEPVSYWYFTYTVTNRTGRDQVWAPQLVLFTDAGEIMVSGRGVPTRVTDGLKELLGNELLEGQNEIIGDIRHGREHAREGLVVWPARIVDVNEMSLFVAGISGETATVQNPVTGKLELLRKTLQRDYLVPGEVLPRGSEPVQLVRESWVMR